MKTERRSFVKVILSFPIGRRNLNFSCTAKETHHNVMQRNRDIHSFFLETLSAVICFVNEDLVVRGSRRQYTSIYHNN